MGVNILEDARHCSVLYMCKYFVVAPVYDSTVYTTESSAASGSVHCTQQGAELHVDLSKLQKPLLRRMCLHTGPELHLELSTLHRHVLHHEMSGQ